ncbi:MAG: glutaminyl-peptide cyclotransferase [Chitinophagaceae bacterium]|nr:glutaminyl-peptide cyclotransferase [Chitinophagaceae bacterium]
MRAAAISILLIFLFSCNGDPSNDYDPSLPIPKTETIPAPTPIPFKVTGIYPHDPTSFTQGLEFFDGILYEGTGELKKSKLRVVDIKSGKPLKSHTIEDPTIFGEGITILNNRIFQLTWQNKKIFEYTLNDITKPIRTYNWNHEGWGATNNGKELIISDGTSNIYFVTPDENGSKMNINKIISVRDNKGPVDRLNELELIDGALYANRWLTDDILRIDTANGHVTGIMNLRGLMKQYAPEAFLGESAVLNGIAYDSAGKKVYITGKDWPKLFEMELVQ